jgi:hypothetical protein
VTVAGSRGYFGLGLLLASPDARLLRRGGRGAVRRLIGWVMTCDGLDPSGALMGPVRNICPKWTPRNCNFCARIISASCNLHAVRADKRTTALVAVVLWLLAPLFLKATSKKEVFARPLASQ